MFSQSSGVLLFLVLLAVVFVIAIAIAVIGFRRTGKDKAAEEGGPATQQPNTPYQTRTDPRSEDTQGNYSRRPGGKEIGGKRSNDSP